MFPSERHGCDRIVIQTPPDHISVGSVLEFMSVGVIFAKLALTGKETRQSHSNSKRKK
jgi:hypothetical protein